jgi:hypothetical protein
MDFILTLDGFDEELRFTEDLEFYICSILRAEKISFVHSFSYNYNRTSSETMSQNDNLILRWTPRVVSKAVRRVARELYGERERALAARRVSDFVFYTAAMLSPGKSMYIELRTLLLSAPEVVRALLWIMRSGRTKGK